MQDSLVRFKMTLLPVTSSNDERRQAWQHLGIAHRLARDPEAAQRSFKIAMDLSSDEITKALIYYDLGMVYLDTATIGTSTTPEAREKSGEYAKECFSTGLTIATLHCTCTSPDECGCLAVGIGLSFMTRYHHHFSEKCVTLPVLRYGRDVLARAGEPIPRQNHSVWAARISLVERYLFAVPVLTGLFFYKRPRRFIEYSILIVGGERLYRFLKD